MPMTKSKTRTVKSLRTGEKRTVKTIPVPYAVNQRRVANTDKSKRT